MGGEKNGEETNSLLRYLICLFSFFSGLPLYMHSVTYYLFCFVSLFHFPIKKKLSSYFPLSLILWLSCLGRSSLLSPFSSFLLLGLSALRPKISSPALPPPPLPRPPSPSHLPPILLSNQHAHKTIIWFILPRAYRRGDEGRGGRGERGGVWHLLVPLIGMSTWAPPPYARTLASWRRRTDSAQGACMTSA